MDVAIAGSVEELVGGAPRRAADKNEDSHSGSWFEWVDLGGRRCLLKHLCVDDDWIMRATGDLGVRQVELWRRGLFQRLPEPIDPALLGVAAWRDGGRNRAALLMPDVGSFLVPPGSSTVAIQDHRRFLDHMAWMHAALAGAPDLEDVFPLAHHYMFLGPETARLEVARGTGGVPAAIGAGWAALGAAAPRAAGLLRELVDDPSPLVRVLRGTPQTVVHGDWKLGNLGVGPGGRTILLDWDRCGWGPAALDLAWYLAVNCDRLPESKEDAIDHYRRRLEAHGVDTAGWWERQLALGLLGGMLQLGWAKAGGDPAEIAWWEARALAAEPLLG